ncbi:hypothetical protein JCM16358_07530 [Halanaerocella petrolearia]
MKWLAKRLALLFFLVAILVISLAAVANNLNIITIIKRSLLGGILFSLLGATIGQLISYQLDKVRSKKVDSQSSGEKATVKEESELQEEKKVESDKEELESSIEGLDFDQVDETEENIVNMAQDDPEEMADLISNLNSQE